MTAIGKREKKFKGTTICMGKRKERHQGIARLEGHIVLGEPDIGRKGIMIYHHSF